MKKYKVTYIQHYVLLFRSRETKEEEIVEANTFKEAREIIRNKYQNISNINIEEIHEEESV
jgi:hypothetical protein